jgi:transcriptional regulator with XRE-family HTH domain
MAERTKVSNAYLSQIERGMHAPSVRVLRSIAKALDLSAEAMLAQAGLFEDDAAEGTDAEGAEAEGTGTAPSPGPSTEAAIRRDPKLTSDQKEALLSVYRSYLAGNRGA